MKNISRIILVLIIVLIVAGGFLLFLFRNSVADSLRRQIETIPTVAADQINIKPTEALDTSLLKNSSFTALVNHVINFDFTNVCRRAGSDQVVVKSAATASTTSLTDETAVPKSAEEKLAAARRAARPKCAQGNSAPFITESADKNKK